jgi:tetratricopeptide (TPR) repeat protein
LALHQELGGRTGFGLYQLGAVLFRIGRPAEAVERQREALEFFRDHRNRQWEGLAMFRMAEALLRLDQLKEATDQAGAALRILRETRHAWGQGHALCVLGDALEALGQQDAARAHRVQALELFERIRVPQAAELRALLDRTAGCELSTSGAASSAPSTPDDPT